VLDQVEEGRFAPVDVVEHEHQRPLAGRGLEEPADRPERLLARGHLGYAHQLRDVPADELLVLVALEHGADLGLDDIGQIEIGQAGGQLDRLDDREVRDALPVGQAPAAEDLGATGEADHELLDQPGLADAGRPQDREQLAGGVALGRLEGLTELGELSIASHHRRVQATRDRRDHLADAEQTPGRDGLGFPLHVERLDRLGLDGLAHQAIRRMAEEDLAGRRLLLEAGGHVHGVAGHDRGIGCRSAGHDLAGVHADSDLDRYTSVPLELLVEGHKTLAHVRRRPGGAKSVVFVKLWDAEHGHHGVADVLLDRAPMALDRETHRLEVAGLHIAERLRVQAFAESCGTRDVAEDHADDLADLSAGRRGRQRPSAGRTELELVWAVAPAVRAGNHRREPTGQGAITQLRDWMS
jgi:hypothetical protein